MRKIPELKCFLEEKYLLFNQPEFVTNDPISIPHLFNKKEDIEIAAFLTASITWGKREQTIKNARLLMKLMENTPHDFVLNAGKEDKIVLNKFVHRTFNGSDCLFFLEALKNIYINHGGLEQLFTNEFTANNTKLAISNFRKVFFKISHLNRNEKHIANPAKGSAVKRINMFLRWMVRNDNRGVDFGLWKNISPAKLMIPLDVHSGNVARKLNLLKSNQNNWNSVEELTLNLKEFDSTDPVKYDFALFGLGIFEKF